MKKFLLLSFLSIGCFYQSNAQELDSTKVAPPIVEDSTNYKPVRLLLGFGVEFGGDDVATVYFDNGKSQTIKAGTGVLFAIGAEFHIKQVDKLRIRSTVGYKIINVPAENANVVLRRIPLHLTANWMATEDLRLGTGIVKHAGIKFKADGIGEDATLNANTGLIFEIAYGGFGISYTVMEYKDEVNNTYSANNFGITFSGVLPMRK